MDVLHLSEKGQGCQTHFQIKIMNVLKLLLVPECIDKNLQTKQLKYESILKIKQYWKSFQYLQDFRIVFVNFLQ